MPAAIAQKHLLGEDGEDADEESGYVLSSAPPLIACYHVLGRFVPEK